MLHDPDLLSQPVATRRRSRQGIAERLMEALDKLAGSGQLIMHRESAWASITFAGTRHTITWRFCGAEAIADGESLIATLPDHEFTLRGHLVAEAAIVDVAHRLDPGPELTVTAEVLLLEECA